MAVTLNVDNISKIPSLERALNSGRINIILVFAEWCGACHKFRKNIWNPMIKKNALHNRIAVRDDVLGKTSLANTQFDYLPSILVVDEKGVAQTFQTPEGKLTNATPTPKSLNDMVRMVNVPVEAPAPAPAPAPVPSATMTANEFANQLSMEPPRPADRKNLSPLNNSPLITSSPQENKKSSSIPEGLVYTPTPSAAPAQKGGRLLQSLESASRGVLPAAILGGLSLALKGGKRRNASKASTRRVRRGRKVERRTRRHT